MRGDPRELAFRFAESGHSTTKLELSRSLATLATAGYFTVGRTDMAIETDDYHEWIRRFDTLDAAEVERARQYGRELPRRPRIDVVMPVFDPPERFLEEAIASIKGQIYENWTLCIVDDASTRESVRKILQSASRGDDRVRVEYLEGNRGIAGATNAALSLGSGEFVAMVDHDDVLPPHALLMVADRLNRAPDANLVYSDFDFIDEHGSRDNPFFKPDYDHFLHLGLNLPSHLTVYRRSVLERVGGMRGGFHGSADYDLSLRVVERIYEATIQHLPHVLYGWRMVPTSAAHTGLEAAVRAAMEAVRQSCARRGIGVAVTATPRSWIWNRVRATKAPTATVVALPPGAPGKWRNEAVRSADSELVAFVDERLRPRSEDWLPEMTAPFAFDTCAAVGARVVSPGGTVVHSGILLGVCEHSDFFPAARAFHGLSEADPTYFGRAEITHRVTGVSGALVLRKTAFEACGGFDESLEHPFALDLDFCLRLRKLGGAVLLCPHAVFEASSDIEPLPVSHPSAERLRETWGSSIYGDSTYNPNLTASSADFRLADPPRASFPWKRA